MRHDCGPSCSKISAKHHRVALLLVFGMTDEQEPESPIGQRLTKAQAYRREYPLKELPVTPAAAARASEAARTSCARLLRNDTFAEVVKRHEMSRAERVDADWAAIRGKLVATAGANQFDFVTPQDPDSDARVRLRELYAKGVEVRDPTTGEVRYRAPTGKEEQKAIDKAAQFRMKRPSELTEDQRSVVTEFSYDPSRGILKYRLETLPAARLLAEVDGKRSLNVNVAQVEEKVDSRFTSRLALLEGALHAVAEGQECTRAWVEENAALSGDERVRAIGVGARGTVEEVVLVVMG